MSNPPSQTPSPNPIYNHPQATRSRSASSYEAAENGVPDGPEINGSYFLPPGQASSQKSSNHTAESSFSDYHFAPDDARNGERVLRAEDKGAIDLGDIDGEAPHGVQRQRGSFQRMQTDNFGLESSRARLGHSLMNSPTGVSRVPSRGPPLGPSGLAALTPERLGKIIGTRLMRTVRRGNLLFLVVFVMLVTPWSVIRPNGFELKTRRRCLIVFFSALGGVGYVPEEGEVPTTVVGHARAEPAPVPVQLRNEETQALNRKKNQEQRELEQEWARKKRPKDVSTMISFLGSVNEALTHRIGRMDGQV